MSQDTPSSRAEKKALRDAERHKKGKKRKHDETEEADGKEENAGVEEDSIAKGDETTQDDDAAIKPKKAKRRKKTAAATSVPSRSITGESAQPADGDGTEIAAGAEEGATPAQSSQKHRFILFIGNLPYTATDDSLNAHFNKLSPFNLRHRTDPKTKQSKGFAFLEFENYDRMETCLKLYHHSMFDPDDYSDKAKKKKGGKGGRRINVELTAGGGGKGDGRKEKIKVKNERLEEERKRRQEAEWKEKANAGKKEMITAKSSNVKASGKRTNLEETTARIEEDAGAMHPSRLAMMKK